MQARKSTTRWRALIIAAGMLAAIAALPAGAQVRVQAELPQAATAGRAETLTVRLVGDDGQAVAAPRELAVTVLVDGTDRRLRATLPAGAKELPLRLTSRQPASHTLEVIVEGLDPVWVPWVILPPAQAESPAAPSQASALAAEVQELRQVTAVPSAAPPHAQPRRPAIAAQARAERPAAGGARDAGTETEPPATAQVGERVGRVEPADGSVVAGQRERLVLRRVGGPQPEATAGRSAPAPGTARRPPAAEASGTAGADGAEAANETEADADGAEGADEPAAAPPGRLRFSPSHLRVPPGSDGRYRRPLQATWYVGDFPAQAEQDVEAVLQLIEQPEGFLLAANRLRVPAAAMTGSVLLEASGHGRARIQALLPGREVADVLVELLPAQPAGMRFSLDQAPVMRRLGPVDLRVWATLVDREGRATVARDALVLELVASGAGDARCEAPVAAGEGEGGCDLTLARFGTYVLTAKALGGRLEPGQASFELAFDWTLLLWALLGGLAGATIQVARRRVKVGEPLVRTYLLGAAAALVVVLLLVFGGVVWLDVMFPEGVQQAAERSSQPALFLLGLLAGFGGEAVFAALDRRFAWTAGKASGNGPPPGGGPQPPGSPFGDGEEVSPVAAPSTG